MCLIIYKPNASDTIASHILDNAERINQDGFGITYLDNFKTHKTMNYKHARKLVTAKRPFVAHYRFTTRGETNRSNCHPFTINKSNILYSNGTVADLGSDTVTDTGIVANYLKTTPRSHWHKMLTMTDVRFALVQQGKHRLPKCADYNPHDNDINVCLYGKWHDKDGIKYSKNNCFSKPYVSKPWSPKARNRQIGYNQTSYVNCAWSDDYGYGNIDPWSDGVSNSQTSFNTHSYKYDWQGNHKVAVYGTLKSMHGNHDYHLSDATLVGAGTTIDKYPMVSQGVPYVYHQAGVGHKIAVEVYDVNSYKSRKAIDDLERHPSWYTRRQIDINLDNGTTTKAWLYFQDDVPFDIQTQQLISCY
nr:hypothetical protein [uncultured Mediterranean phage uvMED]